MQVKNNQPPYKSRSLNVTDATVDEVFSVIENAVSSASNGRGVKVRHNKDRR